MTSAKRARWLDAIDEMNPVMTTLCTYTTEYPPAFTADSKTPKHRLFPGWPAESVG